MWINIAETICSPPRLLESLISEVSISLSWYAGGSRRVFVKSLFKLLSGKGQRPSDRWGAKLLNAVVIRLLMAHTHHLDMQFPIRCAYVRRRSMYTLEPAAS